MEMEGRGLSDLYRNTSEEMFIRTLMEGSVGMQAPTMEMLGFKNLTSNFRADSEELFKSWLTTGENQGHNSTMAAHNRPRQLSRRILTDQALQNVISLQSQNGNQNPTPQSSLAFAESSNGVNGHPIRNMEERGLQASNLYLAKAWFDSSQPMTRSRSSELRKRYVAMQNSQTAIGIEAMHSASGHRVNLPSQEFVEPSPFDGFMSLSNSSSPQTVDVDKVSSVVRMLKGTLEGRKLPPFRGLPTVDVEDRGPVPTVRGSIDVDLERFVAPTNLAQVGMVSREPSQSESSAAAPVGSTGFDASSNSGQTPSACESSRKRFGNGCGARDIRDCVYDNVKEDQKRKGGLIRNGSITSAASVDRGDPTKKRRVERSRKMAEAKERIQMPVVSSDIQSIMKRCENLEKEIRSLKLNLAFMNRKDSEQTKQIEELQKQNEETRDEKERLLEEIERILSDRD